MSLRIRISLYVSLLLLIIISLSYYSSYSQTQLHSKLDNIQNTSTHLIHLTEQLDNNFQKQLLAWTNLLLRGQEAAEYHRYLQKFYQQERVTRANLKSLLNKLNDYIDAKQSTQKLINTHNSLGLKFRKALLIFNQSSTPSYDADKFIWNSVSQPINLLSQIENQILSQQKILLNETELTYSREKSIFLFSYIFLIISFIFLLLWLLDKNIGKPLSITTNVAKAIAAGDYSLRVSKTLPGEFNLFSSAFNKMMDHISEKNDEVEQKMDDLQNEIVRRQVIEKELHDKKLIAEDASKTKSEFLSTMSHEIRTPLNIVTGYIELLELTELTPQQRDYLKSIVAGSESLLAIINDVLDFAKIESGKLIIQNNVLSLSDLLDDINNLFTQLASEKNIQFDITVSNEVPKSFVSDIIRLKQILINLLSNAFKFTEKGSVNLFIDATPSNDSSRIDLTFKVKDSGIGIDNDYIDKIFNHFEQQSGQDSRKFAGTGLGLAISKKLSLLLNADLTVYSILKEGSTFTLKMLDVQIEKESLKSNIDTPENALSFRPAKILIADDMESNRNLIKAYLNNQPVEFLEATNGQEAIDLALEHMPDLILMDIKMPEVDGIQATRAIKQDENLKNVPIIAVSASSLQEDDTDMKLSLFDAYLTKPVRLKLLLETLSKYLIA